MARQLSHRLSALERRRATLAPHVLEVSPGQTIEDAIEAFAATWGDVQSDHAFIVVPRRITTDERASAELGWVEQQRRLLAEVKNQSKETIQ